MNPQEPIETTPKTPTIRGKITTYRVGQLSQKTGISRTAIRSAVVRGELRCLRVNSRVWLIESQDAARWIELLSTTTPGDYRNMVARSQTTHNNLCG
ncbi:MAG: hypothetical protein WCS43_14005 [Verrucomicrobiota bacterium]